MEIAVYARVSTERQEREQTVVDQLAAVRLWAERNGHLVCDTRAFVDEGYSGARLDRPALDRLRDAVAEGDVEAVAVLSPDRLARKYVHQMLLLDEFRRAGCAVLFVEHPIGDDPNDQLLLQIQSAVAEYEGALLGERFRRGKLQKARAGQYHANKPPYGYRYVPKTDGALGHVVVEEAEAAVVRLVYGWLVDDGMTVARDTAASSVDLSAFGNPTIPTSAISFSPSRSQRFPLNADRPAARSDRTAMGRRRGTGTARGKWSRSRPTALHSERLS